jgi:hypothetical protein
MGRDIFVIGDRRNRIAMRPDGHHLMDATSTNKAKRPARNRRAFFIAGITSMRFDVNVLNQSKISQPGTVPFLDR